MSTCAKEYCRIYRDKDYCKQQSSVKFNANGECDCFHARRACEIGEHCGFKGNGCRMHTLHAQTSVMEVKK